MQGFQKAVARLPLRVLRAVAAGVRQQIERHYGDRLEVNGFRVFGCDGSRVECPRSEQLQRRLGQAGKPDSAPTIWVTALVCLKTGLLFGWRLGRGTASETRHLMQMLGLLPRNALLVADAAYLGYELARAVLGANRHFLFRLSSSHHVYTQQGVALEQFQEGPVYYWPQWARAEEPAAGAGAADPGARQEAWPRRVAADQRARPGATERPDRSPVVPLEVAQRGAVPNLQTDPEAGEVVQPERAAGAPRGGGVAVGGAVALGACGLGVAAQAERRRGRGQPAAGGAGDSQRASAAGDTASSPALRATAPAVPFGASIPAHQPKDTPPLATPQRARTAQTSENPRAQRTTKTIGTKALLDAA